MQTNQTRAVHLISLGCARNQVDSEVMLGTLLGTGWRHAPEPELADVIIVNTCGFIASAKEESIDHILQAAELKKEKPDLKLVVAGCLTQRYKSQLVKGLPEVDLFVGTDEFSKIAKFLEEPQAETKLHAKRTHYLYNETLPRVNTLSQESAYVKVAEGCEHNCAFCIIPAIRGRLRSRPVASVCKEVEQLVASGVVEVNLIAQDLAAYGRDIKDGPDLLDLLKALCKIEGLKWLRLLYVYPENISDEFLEFFASEPKIVKYLDIPVQHASSRLLTLMNRGVSKEQLIACFKRLRDAVPQMTIRTSVMVGFPSETEADFQELCDFIKAVEFDHLGCFTYSQEEGTVAARMPDQIEETVKKDRYERLMIIQREISKNRLRAFLGKTLPVLVKGPSEDHELVWEGRLSTQAPSIDGVVYLNDGPVKRSHIQMVRITETHDYDLVGEVIE